jgi:hypothetical protein
MDYHLLCVDQWRSEWYYRNYGVVIGDRRFKNVRDAADTLYVTIHSLHKTIVLMVYINGDLPMYVVYKDKTSPLRKNDGGNQENRVPGDSSRKRRRGEDHDNNVRTTRLRVHGGP